MIEGRPANVQTSAVLPLSGSNFPKPIILTPGQQKSLEGLEKGRRLVAERSRSIGARNAAAVIIFANLDIKAGNPSRGRAKRIAIDMAGQLTERSVKRILDRLSECPIRKADNPR